MQNNHKTAEFMHDVFKSKAGGITKKNLFEASFFHYFKSGDFSNIQISQMASNFQNPSGNIPDNFIAFYYENKDLLYQDIKTGLLPNLFLADYFLIEKYNLDETDLAKSFYSKICFCLRIPE